MFASFEADTEAVTWFQVNEASDVIDHVINFLSISVIFLVFYYFNINLIKFLHF